MICIWHANRGKRSGSGCFSWWYPLLGGTNTRNDWRSKTNDVLEHQECCIWETRSANTILQSFCQTPFGIRSAGVGPNRNTRKLGYYNGNWGLPKTVYQDNWGHGPTLLSSKVTASQINDFTGRRMRGDLIETFKIINGFVNYGHNISGTNTAYRTRHHPLRSAHEFFNDRVIKYWNQLPLRVRNSSSINAFKAGLDLFKLSKPDSPDGFWKLSE